MPKVKMTVSKFDWKIWAKKLGKNAVYIIIAGLAATYGDSPYYLAIAPIIMAIENWIKHR